jgi:hypothetical protein
MFNTAKKVLGLPTTETTTETNWIATPVTTETPASDLAIDLATGEVVALANTEIEVQKIPTGLTSKCLSGKNLNPMNHL